MTGVLIGRGGKDPDGERHRHCGQRDDPTRRQQQAKDRGQHPDLGLPASRTVRSIDFCCLSTAQPVVYIYGARANQRRRLSGTLRLSHAPGPGVPVLCPGHVQCGPPHALQLLCLFVGCSLPVRKAAQEHHLSASLTVCLHPRGLQKIKPEYQ